jgi:P pilus assembly chaperone PapD
MGKPIVLNVLMLFGACETVSPVRQSAVVPISTTTGAAKAQASASSLTISRMEISAGVMHQTPLDIGTTYTASQEKVYCYLEFKDVKTETTIYVVWMLGQKEMDKIPLVIKPYSKFRTWASKKINGMKGEWKVNIFDDNGNLMKSASFIVQ